jgi:hypothetical protein
VPRAQEQTRLVQTFLFLEWAAQVLALWDYSALMRRYGSSGHTVGLVPVAQITLLPAASVYLETRRPLR